jgi:hypothetical protein
MGHIFHRAAIAVALTAGCDAPSGEKGGESVGGALQSDDKARDKASAAGAVALATKTRDGVCACKDEGCGQKLLDTAGAEMPALMQATTAEERDEVTALRDATFACMDALVDANPDAKQAVAAMEALASAICACETQECAAKEIEGKRSVLDGDAAMSSSAAGQVLVTRMKAAKCLEAIGYEGSTIPGLAAKADAMVVEACACKNQACREGALKSGARLFAEALTPNDMAVVRDATARASKCVAAAPG